MKCANFIALLLMCSCHSYHSQAANSLTEYYAKIDECIETEQKKPDITADNVLPGDVEYLFFVKSIRIANCSKEQEHRYINSPLYDEEKITTLSQYNQQDLSKMSKEEVEYIKHLDKKLANYNLEVDLLSLYDQLKVSEK